MANNAINYQMPEEEKLPWLVSEEAVGFVVQQKAFTLEMFERLGQHLNFSQAEWAEILHISLRTLQRYLKDEKPFEGLQAELLHHINRLAETGILLFTDAASFEQWLRTPKMALNHQLDFSALKSATGIRLLQQELGRIAYGVYI